MMPASGAGGRWFESGRPQKNQANDNDTNCVFVTVLLEKGYENFRAMAKGECFVQLTY